MSALFPFHPLRKRHLFSPLVSLLCLLAAPGGIAQPNYRPGYVVTSSGDTLKGLVNDHTEVNNARECSFKAASEESPRKYGPDQLGGYGFANGKMYESKRVRLDSTTSATVFVELLVKGRLSLYHYKVGDHYFAGKSPEELVELTRVEKTIERDGVPYVVVREFYKGTLIYMTLDCPRLKRKLDHLPFVLNDLIRVVHEYNTCNDTSASLRTKRKFITAKAGLTGGVNRSWLHFSTDQVKYNYLTKASLDMNAYPFAGLYVQTTLPWVTDRITLWFEGQYSQHAHTSYREFKTAESIYREDVSISRQYLRFPVLLRYTYPKGSLRPFAGVGCRLDVTLSGDSRVTQERELVNTVTTLEQPAVATSSSEVGGVAGAGLELHLAKRCRLQVELRGSLGTGLVQKPSQAESFTSRTTNWSLQVGLGF
jgi:hypothetical protein